jgi:8-oxo-dGTP diphosphatase
MEDSISSNPPIVAVGGIIYRHRGDAIELLLIKKKYGYWTLPKGLVKAAESDITAVEREVHEEVGLHGIVGQSVRTVSYTIYKAGQPRTKQVTYYLFAANKGRLRLSDKEKIAKARWFDLKQALRRIRRKRVREVAQHGATLIDEGSS